MAKTQPPTNTTEPVSVARLRLGLSIWVISYIPITIPLAAWLYATGVLPTARAETIFIFVTWGIEIAIGWLGLFIGGRQILRLARGAKPRQLPKLVWRALWSGRIDYPDNQTK